MGDDSLAGEGRAGEGLSGDASWLFTCLAGEGSCTAEGMGDGSLSTTACRRGEGSFACGVRTGDGSILGSLRAGDGSVLGSLGTGEGSEDWAEDAVVSLRGVSDSRGVW